MILECQKHEDYKASVQWLLDYVQQLAERGRHTAREGKDKVSRATESTPLGRAIDDLRKLLERIANNKSLDPISDAYFALADDAKRDPELEGWLKNVKVFANDVLLRDGYVLDEECARHARDLRESGRRFYDDKYKMHFDDLFRSLEDWAKGVSEDSLNQRFADDWARLTKDLLFDKEGSLKFKSQLWNDVRRTILPQLVSRIGYIPLPRIEYTDSSWDFVVENLTLSGKNLLPNIVSLETHNFWRFSPYEKLGDESRYRFVLTLEQIQADLRDVVFWARHKQGLKFRDRGVADVVVGGQGITVTALLVSPENDPSSVFRVKDVHVKVSSLKLNIRELKYEMFYKMFKGILLVLIKRRIQRALTDSVRTGLEYIDGLLVRVRDRVAQVPEGWDEKTRSQVLHEIFSRRKEKEKVQVSSVGEGKERTSNLSGRSGEAATTGTVATAAGAATGGLAGGTTGSSVGTGVGDKHLKLVTNRRESMLPDVDMADAFGNKAGWLERAEKEDEEARKGEDWRSDAFNIHGGKEKEVLASERITAGSGVHG